MAPHLLVPEFLVKPLRPEILLPHPQPHGFAPLVPRERLTRIDQRLRDAAPLERRVDIETLQLDGSRIQSDAGLGGAADEDKEAGQCFSG